MRAQIGDTVKSKHSKDEFVVTREEVDENGTQWVWRCECPDPQSIDCMFSACSYGMPDTNFEIIKRKN